MPGARAVRAAVLAAIAAFPAGVAHPQSFFDLYRSAPRAEPSTAVAQGARPSLVSHSPGPISDMIPTLTQVASASIPSGIGANTLVPDLHQTSIPTTSGGFVAMARGPANAGAPVGDMGACIAQIRAAEKRHGIPENLLMAIGLQEAGRQKNGKLTIWPWSINSHGKTSMFDTKAEAIAFVRSERAAGKTLIDVGCMQINLRWHPDAFASLDEAFDPAASAEYAARFLARLHSETGDWFRAAGNYHSVTPEHHQRYVAGVRRNLEVALAYSEEFRAISEGVQETFAVAAAPSLGQNGGVSLAGGRGYGRRMVSLPQETAIVPRTVSGDETRSVPERVTGNWWGASEDGGSGAVSIYSRRNLRPVIPDLNNESPNMGT